MVKASAWVDPPAASCSWPNANWWPCSEANLRGRPAAAAARALRLAAELNFALEPESRRWIERLAPLAGQAWRASGCWRNWKNWQRLPWATGVWGIA
jgi:hypothetical protein